jgi:Major Facilitator Superfamily
MNLLKSVREVLFGPWRAVPVLGITQILAWGAIFYPPVLTVPLIAAERGWSVSFAMGGLSTGMLVGGLVSPRVGLAIDRYGGHRVMTVGSLAGALGLVLLVYASSKATYLSVWILLGAAMAASLYDPAFATLGRIFGAGARRPITLLTLAGGFASTVSWPATHVLIEQLGWRGTYLVYGALLAFVAAPLHALALPRTRARVEPVAVHAGATAAVVLPATGWTFALVASGFAAYAFVPSGLAAHLLAIFGRQGLPSGTVVAIGALFGPAQVAARVFELAFARRLHPLWLVRAALALLLFAFALLAFFGVSVAAAASFALLFGAANGLLTVARGTVPLALFGAPGYGGIVGRIAGPFLAMQSVAPLALAFVAEQVSDGAALMVVAVFGALALACFAMLRRPVASADRP